MWVLISVCPNVYAETASRAPFCAIVRGHNAIGETVGQAVDALFAAIPPGEAIDRMVLRRLGPDEFFSAEQEERLKELSERLGPVADRPLSAEERSELDALILAESEAVALRSAAIAAGLGAG